MPLLDTLKRGVQPVAIRALLAFERLESGVACNLLSPEFTENPYRMYDRLREKGPVHRMRLLDAWMITGYRETDSVLRDHRTFTNGDRGFAFTDIRTLLHSDPPDHTRLRALVVKAFASRAVARMEGRIRQIADDLLDAVEDSGRFDVMKSFAAPLPVIVIAEMMGIPPEDRDRFRTWSDDLALSVEPILSQRQIAAIRKSWDEIFDYFDRIIDRKRKEPGDDLISALIAAEEEGAKLTHDEVLSTLMLLLVAGNETTRNLIGNGLLALLNHPDQLRSLRDDPGLMDGAVAELLRYDSPVQLDGRYIREDCTVGGKRLRAGQQVLCALGAANRDPSVFAEPHRLNIARDEASHISFGRGIHYCLGAALAMLEGKVALGALLERFGSIAPAATPRFRKLVVLRGLDEFWIEAAR